MVKRDLCTKFELLCLEMAEIETFVLLPYQLIYPSNHAPKSLFMSTVTSVPNLSLVHLQTAEIQLLNMSLLPSLSIIVYSVFCIELDILKLVFRLSQQVFYKVGFVQTCIAYLASAGLVSM